MGRSEDVRAIRNVNARRVAVRSIAWLDGGGGITRRVELEDSGERRAFAAWETVNQNREKTATSKSVLRSDDFSERVEPASVTRLSAFPPQNAHNHLMRRK